MSKQNQLAGWLINLPNKLTIGRVAVIPILMILFPLNIQFFNLICAFLFALAAATDFFDGYLARKYDSVTKLGKVLDPIADKLLTVAAVVLLSSRGDLPSFLAIMLLCREIVIAGLRLAAKEEGFSIEVNDLGKAKTAILDIGLFCLFVDTPSFHQFGMIFTWVALGFSYYSAYVYCSTFWEKTKHQF